MGQIALYPPAAALRGYPLKLSPLVCTQDCGVVVFELVLLAVKAYGLDARELGHFDDAVHLGCDVNLRC